MSLCSNSQCSHLKSRPYSPGRYKSRKATYCSDRPLIWRITETKINTLPRRFLFFLPLYRKNKSRFPPTGFLCGDFCLEKLEEPELCGFSVPRDSANLMMGHNWGKRDVKRANPPDESVSSERTIVLIYSNTIFWGFQIPVV